MNPAQYEDPWRKAIKYRQTRKQMFNKCNTYWSQEGLIIHAGYDRQSKTKNWTNEIFNLIANVDFPLKTTWIPALHVYVSIRTKTYCHILYEWQRVRIKIANVHAWSGNIMCKHPLMSVYQTRKKVFRSLIRMGSCVRLQL